MVGSGDGDDGYGRYGPLGHIGGSAGWLDRNRSVAAAPSPSLLHTDESSEAGGSFADMGSSIGEVDSSLFTAASEYPVARTSQRRGGGGGEHKKGEALDLPSMLNRHGLSSDIYFDREGVERRYHKAVEAGDRSVAMTCELGRGPSGTLEAVRLRQKRLVKKKTKGKAEHPWTKWAQDLGS